MNEMPKKQLTRNVYNRKKEDQNLKKQYNN